jgi:hypothetical protein
VISDAPNGGTVMVVECRTAWKRLTFLQISTIQTLLQDGVKNEETPDAKEVKVQTLDVLPAAMSTPIRSHARKWPTKLPSFPYVYGKPWVAMKPNLIAQTN